MVLICTVLAMAAPSLRGFFASRQTREAAAQIVALTEFARSQAVSEGRVYRLNLDETDNRYWLTAQTGGAFTTLDSRFSRVFQLPDGTSARWEEPIDAALRGWISFYPDGRTEAARIRLAGRQGEIVDIACLSPAERFGAVVPGAVR
jgi:Tfp pilus assembly protein FimT